MSSVNLLQNAKLSRISTIKPVPFPPLHMLEDALRLFRDNKKIAYTTIVIHEHYVKDDKDTLFPVAISLVIRLV